MANGDSLVLGELQNTATSMTRLVGNVDGNFVFRVDQEDPVNAAEAIAAIGGPGRGAITGFGGASASDKGGVGVAGQGGSGIPSDLGGVGVIGSGGGPNDNRGDGVWGVTNSPGHAGVFGFNFGLGPAVRGLQRRSQSQSWGAREPDGQRSRHRGQERRRRKGRSWRGEC
jgi:hypothetical protein